MWQSHRGKDPSFGPIFLITQSGIGGRKHPCQISSFVQSFWHSTGLWRTDGHTMTAYTALARRRAVKINIWYNAIIYNEICKTNAKWTNEDWSSSARNRKWQKISTWHQSLVWFSFRKTNSASLADSQLQSAPHTWPILDRRRLPVGCVVFTCHLDWLVARKYAQVCNRRRGVSASL